MSKPYFEKQFTALQQSIINRLAEIEQEDEDRCIRCGGEDCICCEYYHDRQRWLSPEDLFDEDYYSLEEAYYADDYEEDIEDE